MTGSTARPGTGLPGLAAGRVLAAALSWAWLIVVARSLSVDEFGILALLLAIGAIVSVVADLGLPLVLMDTVSDKPTAAWTALVLTVRKRLAAGAVAAVLALGAFAVLAPGTSLLIPLVYSGSILATTVYTSVNAMLRSVGSARVEAVNEALSRVGVLALGTTFLALGAGLVGTVVAYTVADLFSAGALWLVAWHRVGSQRDSVPEELFTFRRTGPLAASGIVGILYNRIDIWVLALLRGNRTVALYSAAYRLLEGILLPSSALSALVIPRTAALSLSEKRTANARLVRQSLLLVAPFVVVLYLFGEPLIRTALGQSYGGSASILAVLLLAAPTGAAVLALAPAAAMTDRSRFLGAVVFALLLNVATNMMLIPRWGAAGAAWATVIAQAALALVLWRALRIDHLNRPVPGPVPQHA